MRLKPRYCAQSASTQGEDHLQSSQMLYSVMSSAQRTIARWLQLVKRTEGDSALQPSRTGADLCFSTAVAAYRQSATKTHRTFALHPFARSHQYSCGGSLSGTSDTLPPAAFNTSVLEDINQHVRMDAWGVAYGARSIGLHEGRVHRGNLAHSSTAVSCQPGDTLQCGLARAAPARCRDPSVCCYAQHEE